MLCNMSKGVACNMSQGVADSFPHHLFSFFIFIFRPLYLRKGVGKCKKNKEEDRGRSLSSPPLLQSVFMCPCVPLPFQM